MHASSTSHIAASPTVSFVVPCYKLAHLLGECVTSILSQTYGDFEILILDDCSPDNTPEVAASFADLRVRHIRNEPNLGHLRNYNKGIALARGKYIWLISADDFLSDPTVLARYVRAMEQDPGIGFVCASGYELTGSGTSRVASYSVIQEHDQIFEGEAFLRQLLYCNSVLASSGMVRRTCYERLGAFPLDLPYAGDWYLWCLFALHYKVAYFAQPAITYRIHGNSMTEGLLERDARICVNDDLQVLWRIQAQARAAGKTSTLPVCEHAIARYYARCLVQKQYRGAPFSMHEPECLASIRGFAATKTEADRTWSSVLTSAGDLCLQLQDVPGAMRHYRRALWKRPFLFKVWLKYFLLVIGPFGSLLRQSVAAPKALKG